MIQHAVDLHLNRPVDQVFAYVTDPRNLTTWQSSLIEVEQVSAGPVGAGTQVREVRRMGQRQSEYRAEVQVFEPNKRFVVKTTTQPHVMVSYAFAPHNGGTRLNYEFVMRNDGLMRLLEPLMAGAIKKQSEQDFETLKRVLES